MVDIEELHFRREMFRRIISMLVDDMMISRRSIMFFFFNDTATTEIYTLSLHDALPILEIKDRENHKNEDGRNKLEE